MFTFVGPFIGAVGVLLLLIATALGSPGTDFSQLPSWAFVVIALGYSFGLGPATVSGLIYALLPGALQRLAHVTIQVSGADDDEGEAAEAEERAEPAREARAGPSFSPSLFMVQAVGVIFPLAAIIIFVFAMGNMACSQGNAPAAFCRVLDSVTATAKPR